MADFEFDFEPELETVLADINAPRSFANEKKRQDALDAGGFFDDVGPYVMAATRLPYGDDEVCAAACDATRLWRATQSTGAVVGLASC